MHMLDILSFNLPEAQHGMEMVQWIRDKGIHNALTLIKSGKLGIQKNFKTKSCIHKR